MRTPCERCLDREWDRRDGDRLGKIDDRLATYASLSASGVILAEEQAMLTRRLEECDERMERAAQQARRREGGRARKARDFVRSRAMSSYWASRRGGSGTAGDDGLGEHGGETENKNGGHHDSKRELILTEKTRRGGSMDTQLTF